MENIKFALISNISETSLWVDDTFEDDIDYSSFMFDAKQYNDQYFKSLVNPEERLKNIVRNAVVRPNLIKYKGRNFSAQLDTLINLYSSNYARIGQAENPEICLNGIFLKSYLESNGIPTKILSDVKLDEDFVKSLSQLPQNISAIGISTTFIVDWNDLREVASFIRVHMPETKIIVGGPLAFLLKCLDKDSCIRVLSSLSGYVDYVIIEQNGEITLKNLLQSINKRESPTNIPNLAIISESGFTLTGYKEEKGTFNENVIHWDKVELPEYVNTVPIETSRGCPFRCNFCSYTKFHRYMLKPLDSLREELRSLKNCNNIEYISFVDGSLNAIPHRIEEICQMMIDEQIGLKWHFMGNVKGLSKKQAELMAKSGCEIANIGVESGSDFIRRKMNKPIESNDEIKQAFYNLSNAGIIGRGFFFVGYPGENEDTIAETIDLINNTDMDLFRMAIFRPRVNSDVCLNEATYQNGLMGKGYLWRHNTCDSMQASEYLLDILKNTKPVYDPARGVYEIMQLGISKELALKLNQLKNQMMQNILCGYNHLSYTKIERDFRGLLDNN